MQQPVRSFNAAEMTTEMMCDDGADINSTNLLMRWTLIWISTVASVKAKGVCPRAFIDRISEVICQHDSYSFGNPTPSSFAYGLIDNWSLFKQALCQTQLPLNAKRVIRPRPLTAAYNPINEWEWVSSSADVNLSLRRLSQIVYWWGLTTDGVNSPRPPLSEERETWRLT